MRSISGMPTDELAGTALRCVPLPFKICLFIGKR